MNNLCLIMTGQIRCFFHILDTYKSMIELCKHKYLHILIIAVVSGGFDSYILSEFLSSLGVKYIIIDYNAYKSEYDASIEKKFQSSEYLLIKKKYIENTNNLALKEIPDPDIYISAGVQFYQLYVGITHMLKYESLNDITYDIIMKTRFDMRYKRDFYPHLPTDPWKKLCFNDEICREFSNTVQKLDIEMDMQSVLNYLKKQEIKEPNCRINNDLLSISFGGMYAYNTKSLENIISGSNDILYAFNDFIFFSKRDIFMKLHNLFRDYGIKELSQYVPHFYAAEAQLYIFCINNGINILMYTQLNSNGIGYAYGPVR